MRSQRQVQFSALSIYKRIVNPGRREGLDGPATEEGHGLVSIDGIDVSLIRWMLSLTPRERLLAVQSYARSIVRLRNARGRD